MCPHKKISRHAHFQPNTPLYPCLHAFVGEKEARMPEKLKDIIYSFISPSKHNIFSKHLSIATLSLFISSFCLSQTQISFLQGLHVYTRASQTDNKKKRTIKQNRDRKTLKTRARTKEKFSKFSTQGIESFQPRSRSHEEPPGLWEMSVHNTNPLQPLLHSVRCSLFMLRLCWKQDSTAIFYANLPFSLTGRRTMHLIIVRM